MFIQTLNHRMNEEIPAESLIWYERQLRWLTAVKVCVRARIETPSV